MSTNKVIVINGSAREHGNTDKAVVKISPFLDYETINLCKLNIRSYAYDHARNQGDDFLVVVEEMIAATDIVFATPVYWYAMSGLMKNLFDRLTELITDKKPLGRRLKGKRCYLIACGTDDSLPGGFEVPFARTCQYFEMKFVRSYYVKTVG